MSTLIQYAELEDEQNALAFDEGLVRRLEMSDVLAESLPRAIEPIADPDEMIAQLRGSDAVVTTRPVNSDDYPKGTWLYYGSEEVGVRLPGSARLDLVAKRK